MAKAIPIIAGVATLVVGALALPVVGALTTAQALVATSLITLAATGAGLALQKKPRLPGSQSRKVYLRESDAGRILYYGENLVGGVLFFEENASNGWHVKGLILGEGPIQSIEKFIIDGQHEVTTSDINSSHYVDIAPFNQHGGGVASALRISYGLGSDSQVADPLLSELFPSNWTSNHRLRGMAYVVVAQRPIKSSAGFRECYPNHFVGVQSVIHGLSDVLDSDGSTGYSDNPARIILDMLTRDGYYRKNLALTDIDTTLFAQAISDCDDLITLKAGGSEKRYRAWGGFLPTDDSLVSDILEPLLQACAGSLFITSNGKLGLVVGKARNSNNSFTDVDRAHSLQISAKSPALQRFNRVVVRYIASDYVYSSVDAPPYPADSGSGTKESLELDIPLCPSGSQAQRLAKIAYYQLNPAYSGQITLNMAGILLRPSDIVSLSIQELGLSSQLFEVVGLSQAWDSFKPSDGGDFPEIAPVSVQIQSYDASRYSWDAASEEQDIPQPVTLSAANIDIGTTSFVVVFNARHLSGNARDIQAVVSWSDDGYENHRLQFKKNADSVWSDVAVPISATSVAISGIELFVPYDFRLARIALNGKRGDWSAVLNQNATTNGAVPNNLINFSVSYGGGQFTLTLEVGNDGEFYRHYIEWQTPSDTNWQFLKVVHAGPSTTTNSYHVFTTVPGTYQFRAFAQSFDGVLSNSALTANYTAT